MNPKHLIPAIVMGILSCSIALYCATNSIQWRFHEKPVYQLKEAGETLEFGLREDGVVIWRRISHSTNSPAEATQPLTIWLTNNYWYSTNIVLTNFGAYGEDQLIPLRVQP